MQSDRRQRGLMSMSGITSLVILGCIIFLGTRIVPPYLSNYQFQDAIQNLALISVYNPISEEEILRSVISRANTVGIRLDPKQISVKKSGGSVLIVARYTVSIDLLVRQFEVHFEPSASNQNIVQ